MYAQNYIATTFFCDIITINKTLVGKFMSTNEIVKYTIIAFSAATVLISLICIIVHAVYVKRVKIYSVRYKNLLELNKKFKFYTFKSETNSFNERCNSKRSYDRIDLKNVFMSYIEKHLQVYSTLICRTNENIVNYKAYCASYNELKSSITRNESKKIGVPLYSFIRIENNLVVKSKLSPQTTFTTRISASYTSPQGRNSYKKYYDFDYGQTVLLYNEVNRLIAARQTRTYQVQVERAKMSDSLRYDVMRRDGFRCQICGATAQEGAKLHVDHIIPVSKGGKTELSNLRTLCDRCNLGKSDKRE